MRIGHNLKACAGGRGGRGGEGAASGAGAPEEGRMLLVEMELGRRYRQPVLTWFRVF